MCKKGNSGELLEFLYCFYVGYRKWMKKLFREQSSLKTMITFLGSTGGKIFRWYVLSYQLSLISHYFCCIRKCLLAHPHLGRTLWGKNTDEFTFHFLMLPECHMLIWIAVEAIGLCKWGQPLHCGAERKGKVRVSKCLWSVHVWMWRGEKPLLHLSWPLSKYFIMGEKKFSLIWLRLCINR